MGLDAWVCMGNTSMGNATQAWVCMGNTSMGNAIMGVRGQHRPGTSRNCAGRAVSQEQVRVWMSIKCTLIGLDEYGWLSLGLSMD